MTKSKKKITTIVTIAKEVAKKQGVTIGTAKAIIEQAFMVFVSQLKESGYARINHLGTFNLSITCRSGEAKGRLDFRPSKILGDYVKPLPKTPENGPVLEYILSRDEKKLERYETGRLVRAQRIKMWQAQAADRERERIGRFIAEQLGQPVNTAAIPTEYLTPPRGRRGLQADHYVAARELVEIAGGLPRSTPIAPENPEEHTPTE